MQHLLDPRHNVLGTGQGDGVPQCLVAAGRPYFLAVRAVFCPALGQAHQTLALQLREKPNKAPGGIVLIPKGKGSHAAR